jgi:TrmH family RNA methyltransferase
MTILYTDLSKFLKNQKLPIIGTFMTGEPVHSFDFPRKGWMVIGNESSGISPELSAMCKEKVNIPRFGHAESLNAAIATAVICDNWKRVQG